MTLNTYHIDQSKPACVFREEKLLMAFDVDFEQTDSIPFHPAKQSWDRNCRPFDTFPTRSSVDVRHSMSIILFSNFHLYQAVGGIDCVRNYVCFDGVETEVLPECI